MITPRAYTYDAHPGAHSLPHDSPPSRPVSLDHLSSLGWKVFSLPGPTHAEYESQLMNFAREEEKGYPLTDDSKILWDYSHAGVEEFGESEMIQETLKNITNGPEFSPHAFAPEFLIVFVAGGGYVDIEDPTAKSWIRVVAGPGTVFRAPAGSRRRVVPIPLKGHINLMLLKGKESDVEVVWGKDTEEHPIYQQYLKSLGL